MKIIWNPLALISYYRILEYLIEEWGVDSVNDFRDKVDNVLVLIKKNPALFMRSTRYNYVRRAFITKQNTLFYKISKNKIELLIFWDNRQDAKKLKY
jgi:plasmid stabilization system protein ParE